LVSSAPDILLVDDSRIVLAMVTDVLEAQGFRVRQAENGREALEKVVERRPDLILLDVMMPEIDGYQVCETLRQEQEHDQDYIPVLMITAKSDVEDLARGLAAGADDYIAKPPDHVELVARVRSLLRIRTLQKKLYVQNLELESKNQQLEELANQLEALNRELQLLSVTDGLTKAYNHRHFQERLKAEFARARRHDEPLSCVMLDIDRFKQVNDTHGHPTGDRVLVRLVEVLKEEVRSEDLVARYGGEEFVMLLPSTSREDAHRLAERVRQRVANERVPLPEAAALTVTVSLGVAGIRPADPIQHPDDLLQAADQALYQAKRDGRDRVVVA
jgi:diguanylate cyclase (GGDEF)-like protein